jgi:hypothetical protein
MSRTYPPQVLKGECFFSSDPWELAKRALFVKNQISSADSREIYVIDVYTALAYTPDADHRRS